MAMAGLGAAESSIWPAPWDPCTLKCRTDFTAGDALLLLCFPVSARRKKGL